jgi:hypothetical protein
MDLTKWTMNKRIFLDGIVAFVLNKSHKQTRVKNCLLNVSVTSLTLQKTIKNAMNTKLTLTLEEQVIQRAK